MTNFMPADAWWQQYAQLPMQPFFTPVEPFRSLMEALRPPSQRSLDLGSIHVPDAWGQAVAAAHVAIPFETDDASVIAAYDALGAETDRLYELLVAELVGLEVSFVDEFEPYASALELAQDLERHRRIRVATTEVRPFFQHPLMDCTRGGSYDRLAVVHDCLGHAATGGGFDRHGEYAAWLALAPLLSHPAMLAAGTTLLAENTLLWTTGRPARHKAGVLAESLLFVVDGHGRRRAIRNA